MSFAKLTLEFPNVSGFVDWQGEEGDGLRKGLPSVHTHSSISTSKIHTHLALVQMEHAHTRSPASDACANPSPPTSGPQPTGWELLAYKTAKQTLHASTETQQSKKAVWGDTFRDSWQQLLKQPHKPPVDTISCFL